MIGARKYQVKVDERRETKFQSKISYYMKDRENQYRDTKARLN